MFFDWLARESGALISWWFFSLMAGVAVFPILYRVLGGLPGRGYALSRVAGIMLIGFVQWLPGNFGLLNNSPGSTVLAWLIVLTIGVVSYLTWPEREPIIPWLRQNVGLIIVTEALFVVMFVGWATIRALNPDLTGTEKPMEMAFLAASRRSSVFPPNDPWMSGYAISYYHFGYILIALIANLSGVTNGAAFNLGVALLFALTGVSAFGVAYELVAANGGRGKKPEALRARAPGLDKEKNDPEESDNRFSAAMVGILAAVFAVIMGNLGTALVELPYQTRLASEEYLRFMNIEDRDTLTGVSPLTGRNNSCLPAANNAEIDARDPANWCFWWWFRHSRVVRDLDLSGQPIGTQPITEFPAFSYILSDMHPHVLSMPFLMLTIGMSANLVLRRRRLKFWELVLYAIYTGGMVFLNSWDAVLIPFVIGAEALRRLIANGSGRLTQQDLLGTAGFGAALVGLTAVLYLPFFLGFRSQVGGIVPNFIYQTQPQQFFLMFGPFLFILGAFLIVETARAGGQFNWRLAIGGVGGALLLALAAMVVLGLFAMRSPETQAAVYGTIDQSGGMGTLIPQVITRRLDGIVTQGLLFGALLLIVGRLFAREPRLANGTPAPGNLILTYSPATGFVLLLIAAGAVLTLTPEFVYVRDGFGVRINTIFKFYFQAWLFWSVAGAYAVWSILRANMPITVRTPLVLSISSLVLMGLLYMPFAIVSRAFKEGGHLNAETPLTLNGGPSMVLGNDDEYRVILCLQTVATSDKDVVAEATKQGLAYTPFYGRVSALSGVPTLLGWDNHENQWRGPTFGEANVLTYVSNGITRSETRYDAVRTLYTTTDIDEAKGIIARYGITFIYVGTTERTEFGGPGLDKFKSLTPVCSSGNIALYAAGSLSASTTNSSAPASGTNGTN